MNKTKTARPRVDASSSPSAKPKEVHELGRTTRETIESIVIAFVLAFLFRTFEAEAFVIPTGSMAPTLQGRHKDLYCKNCGYRVRASASEEDKAVESASRAQDPDRYQAQFDIHNSQVVSVTCPLCRYRTSVDPDTAAGREYPSYNGDRIIVAKFPYDFLDPKRWDIVVFKFPNDAKTNYIKRLVGVPRETVRIFHGDIYTKQDGATDFLMEHKPPEKQRAMAQIVYDNNYVVPKMTNAGWPPRWQAWPLGESSETAKWIPIDDGKSFEIEPGKQNGEAWLRYQHLPPTQAAWRDIADGTVAANEKPRPQLITDYYAYNSGILRNPMRTAGPPGLHWVGDLMVEAKVNVRNDQGRILLDLVEGGVHFRATIDVATGEATLSSDGVENFQPKAATSIKGPGSYRLIFSNFDDQLTLWVNGSPVKFDATTSYGPLTNDEPQSTPEDAGDLAPVGVGVAGGLSATVSDLVVKRDIYYIADKLGTRAAGALCDYGAGTRLPFMTADQLADFFSDPAAWRASTGQNGHTVFDQRKEVTFPLAADQFFVLGDNSPASADSRLWDHQHYVDRDMMIGKALFIYWPHSFDRIPGTGIPFPFFPNFKDMGFVR